MYRPIHNTIQTQISANKVIILSGAQRVGKTVLLNQLANAYGGPKLSLAGSDPITIKLVENQSLTHYQSWLGDTQLLIIDEAQSIPELGKVLKFLTHSFPNLTVLIALSSTFVLDTIAPTERQVSYTLYPLSQLELGVTESYSQTRQRLIERLVFGSYPDVVRMETADRVDYLKNLVSTGLLKDRLLVDQVRNTQKMLQLMQLVAHQIGNEISYDDLSYRLEIDRNTVVRYLELFSKTFILFQLGGYSSKLRKEVTKSSKWYFYDNGIRNALINNFDLTPQRHDIDILWENYLASERIKRNAYLKTPTTPYFWRTYDQQELDWVEEINGQLSGYAFKWRTGPTRFPKGFQKAYPNATLSAINPENYLDFIMPNYFNV